MPKSYKEIGLKLRDYSLAALTIELLEQVVEGNSVKVTVGKNIIEHQNSKPNPKLVECIDEIVNKLKAESKIEIGKMETLVVPAAGQMWVVEVTLNPDGTKALTIKEEVTQEKEGAQIISTAVESPEVVVKAMAESVRDISQVEVERKPKATMHVQARSSQQEALKYDVRVDSRPILMHDSSRPRAIQHRVIHEFAEQLINGHNANLVCMGTGTGKSYVIGGITTVVSQVSRNAVIIVPDDNLANEIFKDAITPLHQLHKMKEGEIDQKVVLSKNIPFKEFLNKLASCELMIMTADDPDFHKKAALLKDQVILVDETQQHTFTPVGRKTLGNLISESSSNALLGLTATPTSKLADILGDPIQDVNVGIAMSKGLVRQNYRQMDRPVTDDLVRTAILGYFCREEYFTRGPGVMSLSEIQKMIKENESKLGMSPQEAEQKAIDCAIENNRHMARHEKNFVFSGNSALRQEVLKAYELVASGKHPQQRMFEQAIAADHLKKEVNARVNMVVSLHGKDYDTDEKKAALRSQIEKDVMQRQKTEKSVNLQKDIVAAQQRQIAESINAEAMHLVFPEIKIAELEKNQRLGKPLLETIGTRTVVGINRENCCAVLSTSSLTDQFKLPGDYKTGYVRVKNASEDALYYVDLRSTKPLQLITSDTSQLKRYDEALATVSDKGIHPLERKMLDNITAITGHTRGKIFHDEVSLFSKDDLKGIMPSLPESQRKAYLAEVTRTARKIFMEDAAYSEALHLVYPNISAAFFRQMQAHGTLESYLKSITPGPSLVIDSALRLSVRAESQLARLPESDAHQCRERIIQLAKDISSGKNQQPTLNSGVLCQPDTLKLHALQAHYTASASLGEHRKAPAILDQMRTGLVMHVASDRIFSTGISIKSVLSVQQLMSHVRDSLNTAVETPQLHGRDIRDNDLGAFNQQILDARIHQDEFPALDVIFSEQSAKEMKPFLVYERRVENPTSKVVEALAKRSVFAKQHAEAKAAKEATTTETLPPAKKPWH